MEEGGKGLLEEEELLGRREEGGGREEEGGGREEGGRKGWRIFGLEEEEFSLFWSFERETLTFAGRWDEDSKSKID